MHIQEVKFLSGKYPKVDAYPFNFRNFNITEGIDITTPVTFFVGENGTGKSTLLRAIAHRCDIHIWETPGGMRSTPMRKNSTGISMSAGQTA
jgi:predicted ATPase